MSDSACKHPIRSSLVDGVVICHACNSPLPKIYPDRNCLHRNMGPPEYYADCCGGRGYFPGGTEDGPNDKYCDCEAGVERKRTDSE